MYTAQAGTYNSTDLSATSLLTSVLQSVNSVSEGLETSNVPASKLPT